MLSNGLIRGYGGKEGVIDKEKCNSVKLHLIVSWAWGK